MPLVAVAVLVVLCAAVLLWQKQLASMLWQAAAPVLRLRNTVEESVVSELQAELEPQPAAMFQ